MSRSEDFRRQLQQSIENAVKQAESERVADELRKLQTVIDLQEKNIETLRQTEKKSQELKFLKVLGEGLHIYDYLQEINQTTGVQGKVRKFSPRDGKISYSLVYDWGLEDIKVENDRPGSQTREGYRGGKRSPIKLRIVKKVLGIAIKSDGVGHIWDTEVAKSDNHRYQRSLNPVNWGDFELTRSAHGELVPDSFQLTTVEGQKQFVKRLAEVGANLAVK